MCTSRNVELSQTLSGKSEKLPKSIGKGGGYVAGPQLMGKEGRQSVLAADLSARWSRQKHTPDWPTPIESRPPGHAGEISSASWAPGIPENWTESRWHQSSKWYDITEVAVASRRAFSNRAILHDSAVWRETLLWHCMTLNGARLSRRHFWLSVRPRLWLQPFCLFEKAIFISESLPMCRFVTRKFKSAFTVSGGCWSGTLEQFFRQDRNTKKYSQATTWSRFTPESPEKTIRLWIDSTGGNESNMLCAFLLRFLFSTWAESKNKNEKTF